MTTLYWALYYLMLIIGIVVAGIFLFVHRPTRWRSVESLDASFWVLIVFLLYLWSLIRTTVTAFTVGLPDPTIPQAIAAFFFGIALDVVLILRLGHWLRYVRDPRHNGTKVDKGCTQKG